MAFSGSAGRDLSSTARAFFSTDSGKAKSGLANVPPGLPFPPLAGAAKSISGAMTSARHMGRSFILFPVGFAMCVFNR